jgi:DNA N6-methyl adenine demethylase
VSAGAARSPVGALLAEPSSFARDVSVTGRVATDTDNRMVCVCTGVRWCAACVDPEVRLARGLQTPFEWPGYLTETLQQGQVDCFDIDQQRAPSCADFVGLRVIRDAISLEEEAAVLSEIDNAAFRSAQSGKMKQHYGVRVNFKKQRILLGDFSGLPGYVRRLEDIARQRLAEDEQATAALRSFVAMDAFVLRYAPERQSNLDLHTDDTFSYGEVILGLSMGSDSVLTFVRQASDARSPYGVRVPIPARSLSVLFGDARSSWRHGILAGDIQSQRTSVTVRTLSDELKASDIGRQVLDIARRVV